MFLAQDASLWGELLSRQGGDEVGNFSGSFPEALERLGLDVLVRESLAQSE